MKFTYLFVIFCLAACALPPVEEQTKNLPKGEGGLVIEVKGARNDSGSIYLSLFSGSKGFPDDPDVAIVNRHETIVAGSCRIEVDALPYGDYAVSVLHDEDRDGRMATNLIGVPKEGFGFSGNPKTKLGPPDYDDVRFLLLVPEKRLSIVMQYETVGREKQQIMRERKQAEADAE